ncbi:hypothetical protein [Erythrobacter sp. MTPC3]|uniref:hypothetical protein n=1 Tax=Erythrobacter sp. MTPC3 TaxID=3056564 RepID=UPI0036F4327E
MLTVLCELLDLALNELLVGKVPACTPGKRGPTSRLQRQIDAVAQLRKSKQRFVSKMLDNLLAQNEEQQSATGRLILSL